MSRDCGAIFADAFGPEGFLPFWLCYTWQMRLYRKTQHAGWDLAAHNNVSQDIDWANGGICGKDARLKGDHV